MNPSILDVDVTRLSGSNVNVEAVNYDWGSEFVGEAWEYYEAGELGDGRVMVYPFDDEVFEGHNLEYFSGPMMNYYYPLEYYSPSREQLYEDTKALAELPLCIVRIGDEYGLALTGGGMDLSWEICEAFIRLGYLPPVAFTPPRMAGRGKSETDQKILDAYERAIEVAGNYLENRKRDLETLRGEVTT